MFHWYLLVGNFVIFFGSIWFSRLLLIHFLGWTWSACFGSIVFICYVVSAWTSSQLVLILSLIFGWTLSVQDVSLISFGRKFCNFFGSIWFSRLLLIHVLVLTRSACLGSIVFICYVVTYVSTNWYHLVSCHCRNWLNVNDIGIHVFLFVLFCNIWYVLI